MGRLCKQIWGIIFEKSPQQVEIVETEATCMEAERNNVSNRVIWTAVHYTPSTFDTGWIFCSLLPYWFKRFWFYLTVYIQCKQKYFLTQYHKKSWSSMLKTNIIRMQFLFHLLQPHMSFPQILTQVKKYRLHNQIQGRYFTQNYGHNLVFITWEFVVLEWNNGHWKLNKIVCFGHL